MVRALKFLGDEGFISILSAPSENTILLLFSFEFYSFPLRLFQPFPVLSVFLLIFLNHHYFLILNESPVGCRW